MRVYKVFFAAALAGNGNLSGVPLYLHQRAGGGATDTGSQQRLGPQSNRVLDNSQKLWQKTRLTEAPAIFFDKSITQHSIVTLLEEWLSNRLRIAWRPTASAKTPLLLAVGKKGCISFGGPHAWGMSSQRYRDSLEGRFSSSQGLKLSELPF